METLGPSRSSAGKMPVTLDDLRVWQAQERSRARAKLLSDGTPAVLVDTLLSIAEGMHSEQADCAARLTGEMPAVVVH